MEQAIILSVNILTVMIFFTLPFIVSTYTMLASLFFKAIPFVLGLFNFVILLKNTGLIN
jgi:hypothetical protein